MDMSAYQHMNIRMSTRGKRPLRNLTPNDKVRAIQRIHNGETKASVSRDIGVPESTLRGWCKNEQKLRFMCRQLGGDLINLPSIDNPPEKRTKFDGQLMAHAFGMLPNCDELAFNHLPLHSMDYSAASNAILDNIAFTEFSKRNKFQDENLHKLSTSVNPVLPISAADFTQGNMIHHLNLMSLLNANTASNEDANLSSDSSTKSKSSNLENDPKINACKINSPTLSVKNWAKDPAEQSTSSSSSSRSHYMYSRNDSNNNDLSTRQQSSSLAVSKNEPQPPIVPAQMPERETSTSTPSETDDNSIALLDWCKMFKASIQFLALAAAAAAMQPGGPSFPVASFEDLSEQRTALFGQLNRSFESPLSNFTLSDVSNESYCDSEPEDLSVRSSASKVSSPANSRSQSPTKSSASSASVISDGEQ